MATQAGAGLSRETDAEAAGRQAATEALEKAGTEAADWGLVFATSPHRPHFATILAQVQRVLGTVSVSGCSAWGVLAGGEEIEGQPAVVVLAVRSDRIVGTTLFATYESGGIVAAARELGRQIAAGATHGGDTGPPLVVLLPDPFAARPDLLLRALEDTAPGIRAVGAAASADPSIDRTFQFYGRNVATRSVCGLALKGAIAAAVDVTQGCQPLGPPARITRAEGNVVLELDGKAALEVLRSRLPGGMRDALERLGPHLFLGFPPDPEQESIEEGQYLVRPLAGADPVRGALLAGATVREGMPLLLVVREPTSARDDLKAMLRRMAAGPRPAPPAFGLYFNCAARGRSLYGMSGIDTAYISGAFAGLPVAGFFGNAEIAPLRGRNHLFTYTGVLALCGESG